MHQSSLYLMQRFAVRLRERLGNRQLSMLDVGSMDVNGCFKPVFTDPNIKYLGLDFDPGLNVDIVPKDPYAWKELEDESFDVIISGQVLERIEFPWLIVDQIARKLKPQGWVFLIAPSRGPEHRIPFDCYRFYPDGLRALARWSGLKVLEADVARGSSGFIDGSDQWGDCHCLLTKEIETPKARAEAETKTRPVAGPELPIHVSNPLHLGKNQPYYKFARSEVTQVILERGIKAKRILELGCASGETGKALKQAMTADYYAGIELEEAVAEEARAKLDHVICADIEKTPIGQLGLEEKSFDLLVALDVLEHLVNPWDVLTQLVHMLKPGGHAAFSIPNIQNISILTDLINGKWTYTSAGILDATHLRFFTFESMQELLRGAGLTVVDWRAKINPPIDLQNVREFGNRYEDSKVSIAPLSKADVIQLYTYQYILIGRR
jgi:2-polyprenyl-3-methyl-5-hydroxy-6-metoxy-1,4-benzoquinol methylase